jgi:hypothetical protein
MLCDQHFSLGQAALVHRATPQLNFEEPASGVLIVLKKYEETVSRIPAKKIIFKSNIQS